MLKKGSKLYSILTGSCPKCHQENMYVDKNPFHLKNVIKMNDTCGHCNLKYQLEPSFFYGAMYVSYGVNVAISVAAFIVSFVIFGSTIGESFVSIVVANILLFPLVLRISRNIYINIFVSYDKSAVKK